MQTISGLSPHFPNENTHQWNFSFGRQILGMAVDVGYVGTRSLNIPYSEDLNLLRPSTTPFSAARRPYPRFNTANLVQTGGSSTYHGFTIQADRRMSRGLWFNVNYTLAKGLTDVDLRGYSTGAQQNQYARFLERADDANLRRQQLRFSYVFDLPVGRGQRFLNGISSPLDFCHRRMATGRHHDNGHWTAAQSGLLECRSGVHQPVQRPAGPHRRRQLRVGRDAGLHREPGANLRSLRVRAAGHRPRLLRQLRAIRPDRSGPVDLELWPFTRTGSSAKSAQFQFRWEMFNAFNRANFNNPTTNIQAGDFGLVTTAQAGRSMLFGLRFDF